MAASKCPKCGEKAHFVEHIEKWYCYDCNAYMEAEVREAEPVKAEPPVAEAKSAVHGDFKDYSEDHVAETAPEAADEAAEPVREAPLDAPDQAGPLVHER